MGLPSVCRPEQSTVLPPSPLPPNWRLPASSRALVEGGGGGGAEAGLPSWPDPPPPPLRLVQAGLHHMNMSFPPGNNICAYIIQNQARLATPMTRQQHFTKLWYSATPLTQIANPLVILAINATDVDSTLLSQGPQETGFIFCRGTFRKKSDLRYIDPW